MVIVSGWDTLWVCRVSACPVKMFSIRMSGDWEWMGHPANPGCPGKWPWHVCMHACGMLILASISDFWHSPNCCESGTLENYGIPQIYSQNWCLPESHGEIVYIMTVIICNIRLHNTRKPPRLLYLFISVFFFILHIVHNCGLTFVLWNDLILLWHLWHAMQTCPFLLPAVWFTRYVVWAAGRWLTG